MIKGVQKNILRIFHTLAHLDQGVCLASPWIHCLTWQNTQCKYASVLHPYPKLHISLLEVGLRKGKFKSLWKGYKHHWAIWEYHLRRSIRYAFNFKKITKTPSMLHNMIVMSWCHSHSTFSTAQGDMVDTLCFQFQENYKNSKYAS
jgi:hypothetical protein